jgi:hypothetical protein
LACLLYFPLFSTTTLHKAITGAESRGRFGSVHVNPWITLVAIDLFARADGQSAYGVLSCSADFHKQKMARYNSSHHLVEKGANQVKKNEKIARIFLMLCTDLSLRK